MMSRGYIVIAQNNSKHDYIKMSYALALSIKSTQSEVKDFAICVNSKDDVPTKYRYAFDHIIEIPWEDHAKDEDWKISNKWKYYYMSPFDETVILDTDMLFSTDISYWWDILSSKEAWFATDVLTYKGDTVTSDFYRKCFTSNDLPNVYTAFSYFKKTEKVAELFKLVEMIFNNWEKFFYEHLDETRPKHISGDVAYALAIKILGYESEFTDNMQIPTFVHMKSRVQNIPANLVNENWTHHIPTYVSSDLTVKIGNFKQVAPVHYHCKEWLTDEIIEIVEDYYESITK